MCEQGHSFYIVSTKPSGRSAVRCRTKTCPVRGMLTSQRDAVTLTVSLENSGIEISTQILLVREITATTLAWSRFVSTSSDRGNYRKAVRRSVNLLENFGQN